MDSISRPTAAEPPTDYAQRIKVLRAKLGFTQQRLAERLGVSFATVNRWENGQTKPSQLSWSQLIQVAQSEVQAPPEARTKNDDLQPRLDFTAEPEAVRAVAEGERLSFGHLFNPSFATEISQIDPLPHQRLAVYDHMLKQPRLRFLLADDAGAGKTIMSGLYIREMLSRRLLRRVLVVPPAGLVGNWCRELATLFNLDFTIVSGQDARISNPFIGNNSDRIIVSVDTLAGSRVFSRLADSSVEPYDLVIFDEAHKLSARQDNDFRVHKTTRYKLAEALAGVKSIDREWSLGWSPTHFLLLTATPHMGKDYPYYALWRLLEPDTLSTYDAFAEFPQESRKHYFIRRTKEEMVKFDGTRLYPKRVSDTLGYDLSQGDVSEQRLYNETTDYLRIVYNKAKLLNRSAARLAMSVFQRRLASSTFALLRSFERRIEKLSSLIDDVQAGRITIEQLTTLQRRLSEDDDVFESKTADEEEEADGREEHEIAEDHLLSGVVAASLVDLINEREQVQALRDLAEAVYESGTESKFERLRDLLSEKKFQDEKVIIFTEHRDTLEYLVRRLEGLGYTGQVAQIHGGMHYKDRDAEVERFRKPSEEDGARFLVCTDAAGEGINLQFCWIMINYDIPWNPARLEQRMGRIHRYGQKHDPVIILNLVAPGTREGRVLQTLLNKLETIRKQLKSDKVFDSIGRLFHGVSIKDYRSFSLEGVNDEVRTERLGGILTDEQVKAIGEHERSLYGAGGEVKKELPRLRQEMEHDTYCRLIPGYVRRFIETSAPFIGIDIDGDLGDVFAFRAIKPRAQDPLLPILETYPEYLHERLTVVRPPSKNDGIWLHPGEPLFDRFREHVCDTLSQASKKGAVFVDPTEDAPYLFHLAMLSVHRSADDDIAALAHEETLECRLVGVKQFTGTEVRICPVEHLLLLKGGHGLPSSAQRLAVTADDMLEQARAYLIERVARQMALDRRETLRQTINEREAFIRKGYAYQEAELATARAKQSEKARAGNKRAQAELNRIKEQQRDLSRRRELAITILHREPELIAPTPIRFIAHALVVPSTDPIDREQHDANVERVAMDLAWAWEESEGAVVKDVHKPDLAVAAGLPPHPGFDLLSIRPNGERRGIEVKGRAATGEVEMEDNEWARACNMREDYWLYTVFDCASPNPRLLRVQDPFTKLLVKAKGAVRISAREITAVSETSS